MRSSSLDLFLMPGLIAYLGPGMRTSEHAHHAAQLIHSCDAPFTICMGGRRLRRKKVIVPSNARHALHAEGRRIIMLLAEPHAAMGRALGAIASGQRATPRRALTPPTSPGLSSEAFKDWLTQVLETVAGVKPDRPLHPGVRRALRLIDAQWPESPTLPEVAAEVKLAPTTLTHRFRREMGISFRSYLRWLRIRRVVVELQSCDSLTEAAVAAGFSDQAHLSRSFKQTFGMPPSAILPFAELHGFST